MTSGKCIFDNHGIQLHRIWKTQLQQQTGRMQADPVHLNLVRMACCEQECSERMQDTTIDKRGERRRWTAAKAGG